MQRARFANTNSWLHYLIFFAILAFGFFLRSQEALSHNSVFLKDQGRDLLDVRSIVVDKKLTLIGPYTGLQGVFQGPLYYYLLSIPFAIFHGDPTGILYLFVAASVVAIGMGYAIGRKLYSPIVGLFVAFVYAISPAAAAAATFIWSPFLLIPIMSVYLYLFLLWVKTGRTTYYTGMWICMGLLFHFEIAFAAPFALATMFIVIFVARKKNYHISFFSPIVILIIFLSPLIFFDFRHDHLTIRSLLRLFSGATQGLAANHEPYVKIAKDHVVSFIANMHASFTSIHRWQGYFTFGYILFGLYYLSMGALLEIKLLLLYPIILFLLYALYPFQLYDWYLIGLFPMHFVVMGCALRCLVTQKIGKIVSIAVCLLLFYNATDRLIRLYATPDDGGTAKLKGKLAAIDALYEDAQGKPFSALVFTPVVLTDAYDYLFWWRATQMHRQIPGNKKEGIFYLLIEPDPSKPWSYNGWLETVIQTGAIIYTKTLPSGFIIQKRYATGS